jgi:hypothetical protein
LIEARKYPQAKVCKQEGGDVTASRHHGPSTPSWTEDEEATSKARTDSVRKFVDCQNKKNPSESPEKKHCSLETDYRHAKVAKKQCSSCDLEQRKPIALPLKKYRQ